MKWLDRGICARRELCASARICRCEVSTELVEIVRTPASSPLVQGVSEHQQAGDTETQRGEAPWITLSGEKQSERRQ
jgi:hypothetical protein